MSTPSGQNDLYSALASQLLEPSTQATPEPSAPSASAAPEPTAPEPAPSPEPPKAPLEDLAGGKPEPTIPKLPIDDLKEPEPSKPDGTEPAKVDKVERRIEALKKEQKEIQAALEAERQSKTTLEARAAELEAQAKRAEELEKKISDYENEMLAVRLERSKEYQELVAAPAKAISEELAEIAGRHDIDYAKLEAIMDMDDKAAAKKALTDLTSGMDFPTADMVDLLDLRARYQPVKAKDAELRSKADKILLDIEAREKTMSEQELAARSVERKKVFSAVVNQVTTALPEFSTVFSEAADKLAGTDPATLDVSTQGYNHLAGMALPQIIREFRKAVKERDELLDELSGFKKASSAPGGFTQQRGGEPPKDLTEALLRSGLGSG